MQKKIKCRAAVLFDMGLSRPFAKSKPVKVEEIELDPPGFGEVLVKVAAAGLCHSDLSVVNGNRPRAMPMVLGHEGSGVIEELGEGVDDYEIGDHVVFIFVPSCGKCISCKEGKPALCDPGLAANGAGTLLSGEKKISLNGDLINHQVGVSCFAEYAVVSSKSLVKVDKSLPLDEAALFGCAVITGAGAVFNTANIKVGSTVAVVGLGGTGLAALMGAKAAGASKIIGIDLLQDKLDLAKQLGADEVYKADDPDILDNIHKFTKGGVHYSFECVGSEKAMELAYKTLKRGGTVVSSGLSHPDKSFSIKHVDLVANEKIIKGSFLGSCVPDRDIPAYIDLYRSGRLPVDRLMSDHITLDEVNEGFDKLSDGNTVRQIISFN
jgi:alcohol dehydrogenase|tara:strand:- start:1055 stop:2194 length:1140 start_codon:yes stop_codon:yes gene_type:complete